MCVMAKKTVKAKAQKYQPPKWRLENGVGFDGNAKNENGSPKNHYVVMMCSIHGGVQPFGPFLDEDSAHKWIRENSDAAMYDRFGNGDEPGVSFIVQWLDVPRQYVSR